VQTNINCFETTDRFLERFLYLHKIRFIRQSKLQDGKTKWTYIVNDALQRAMDEYGCIYHEEQVSNS